MKLITYTYQGKERTGILQDDAVCPFDTEMPMLQIIRSGKLPETTGEEIPLEWVKLCAPIPYPEQDVLCLGMNFADHTKEAAKFHPSMVRENYAVYFSKRVSRAVADGEPIDSHPQVTSQVDYEAEVAFILGKDAFCVAPEDAAEYVFGYTVINDVSARDLQTRHKQFHLGKSLDTFTPMGPCIVTADEFAFPPEIGIRGTVNGEQRQNGNTRDWIFDIAAVISDLSAGMTLRAGTIISMGTPAGVGMGFTPPRYLKTGDVVVCEADGIGTLTNTVI